MLWGRYLRHIDSRYRNQNFSFNTPKTSSNFLFVNFARYYDRVGMPAGGTNAVSSLRNDTDIMIHDVICYSQQFHSVNSWFPTSQQDHNLNQKDQNTTGVQFVRFLFAFTPLTTRMARLFFFVISMLFLVTSEVEAFSRYTTT